MASTQRRKTPRNKPRTAGGAVIPAKAPDPIPAEDWAEGALSVPAAARMLDMSSRTVFKYMDRGLLRWGRLGRERRIPKTDVTRLLAGG